MPDDLHVPIESRLSALLSRKFLVAVLAVLITSFLCWQGKITESVFSTVIIAVIGGFLTANVTQKATAKTTGA